ncbi:ATP-dependent Clp protease ATP-binding subunit [Patescibacteria group bacterium]
MSNNILKNFSTNYREVLVKSINLAKKLKQKTVKPEVLLYSLIMQKGSLGSQILQKAKLNKDGLATYFKTANSKHLEDMPTLEDATIKIIEKSAVLAFNYKHPYIATEHLLLAIIETHNSDLDNLFRQQKVDKALIKNQLQIIFNSTSKFQNFTSSFNNWQAEDDNLTDIYNTPTQKSMIDTFTTDLTDKKVQTNIDPVIGRDDEISRLIEILMRRTKNNPMILGDPGVGKTALIEGLAKRIVSGQTPEILTNKKILSLDISLVIAGTMFRGEFENRMKHILEEIKKDPNIIIFIDEIHNIIGAGSTQGSMDIANILKPALARGEIRCIGATTYEDYKKHLEGDAALERRFQLVKVNEPNSQETIKILNGVKNNYETYHNVTITEPAIAAAVSLSKKHITDRFFPDKALDLIDEASAKAKLTQKPDQFTKKIKEKEEQLADLKKFKEDAIINENFKQAILLKNQEKEVEEQINIFKNRSPQKNNKKTIIGKKEICQVVSKITNLPLNELLLQENKKLLTIEKKLAQKIIGQDQALQILAQTIRRAKAGIISGNKPLGSFILIGPSGSGKTHSAKILSQILFKNTDSLIKIDMSEFSEKFNISKLIGAPAGYVGYKENNKLTDAVKRNPNAIVLFDEIEKAHPDVFNLLLQIFDDGFLTDAGGKKINFTNTIIIMTSNLGSEKLGKLIGFDKDNIRQDNLVLESEVKKFFRPEFINRLDKIIVYDKLSDNALRKIIKLELAELKQQLQKQKTTLEIGNSVIGYLLKTNARPEQGARYIKQNIEELIATPLSEQILQTNAKNKKFKISLVNNKLKIDG